MQKTYFKIGKIPRNQFINFYIFLGFYIIFFLLHRNLIYDRLGLLIFVNSLIFLIFIFSVYNIKTGLYIFIFFIPLLSSMTTILGKRGIDIILFLFLSLFLGFIVNKGKKPLNELDYQNKSKFVFDKELGSTLFLFVIILIISCVITIYRYLNFLPLLSTSFHDIAVNVSGTGSRGSIFWTLKYSINAIVGIGLLFIIFNAFNKVRDIIRAVIIIISSNIIIFVIGFYQHYFHPTFGSFRYWAEANRINATLTDPNSLGNYIFLIFPLYIILIIYFKKWYERVFSSLLLIVFLAIALFSGSRNALAGIMLSSVIFLVLGLIRLIKLIIKKSRNSKKVKRTWVSIACLLLVLFIVFISMVSYISVAKPELKDMYRPPKTGISMVDRTVDTIWMSYNVYRQAGFTEGFKSVSSERHFLWAQAVNMFTDYPVTGVGIGSFLLELPNYYEKNNSDVRIMDFTGNYYLQLLSELGITGILLIMAIFFFIIKKSVKYFLNNKKVFSQNKENWFFRGFLISFISMVVLLFFGPHTNFNEIQFTFWLIIGLLMVFIKIMESNKTGGLEAAREQRKVHDPALSISGKINLNMKQRISFIIIIIIFSSSLLAVSWTSLSINIKQNIYGWENKYGLHNFETIDGSRFRWSGIDGSEVIENNKGMMIIPVKDSDPINHSFPLFIRFFIDNKLVKVVKITDKEWHEIKLDLSGFAKNKLTFTMSCSRSWVPKERGLTSDTRELGVMVGEFVFID